MYIQILHYVALYLCVGFLVALITDQSIRATKQVEPYNAREIGVAITLWPIILAIFIYGVIKGYFNNESN